ncbi:hypothetical protein ScPMuIL_007746 [Solemya velum]
MGKEKAGFLTPKAIANRIKAKGLQKLRWYCQMCQKQCRDENGFKCHMMSESHQRQLLLFAENPDEYIDTYSKEFMDGYCELLSRRFGSKRVHCNIVYQEYIHDREHVHMNSTQWETLTDFIQWLGREGKCVVDHTEKGWFVQYIDRSPEVLMKLEQNKAKEKMDMDDEERTAIFIQKQIERASESEKNAAPPAEFTELKRESEEEKVTFSMGAASKKREEATKVIPEADNAFANISNKAGDMGSKKEGNKSVGVGQKRKSALDEIMEFEEKKKEKMNRKENWLHEGIVVKIVTKKLGEKYYKKKGVIKSVEDLFRGVIKMLDSGTSIRVDQSHLETVIPAHGKIVMIVNGAYRGQEAILEDINENKFSCTVSIRSGPLKGRIIEKVQYEDISKLHSP